MNINTFLTLLKTKSGAKEKKEEFIREHIKNTYIPLETKMGVAEAIVKSAYVQHIKDEATGKDREFIHVNSVAKHMSTCMAIVDLYTDLERQKTDGKMLEDFNKLNENGVFDLIIEYINKDELKEFYMVIKMVSDDFFTNEYENHAFISKQMDRVVDILSAILPSLLEKLDKDRINEIVGNIM